MANISQQDAKAELWRRGILHFKLDSSQKELHKVFYEAKHKVSTWLLSRRNGKTYALIILASEQCIRHPNSIVKFVAPTKLQINTILRPLFKQIFEDCPEDIKPEFRAKDYIYYFPNGSEIQLAGTDNKHAEKLRGGDSHIAFIDEAGSCSDLNYVIKSILLPTTLITKGKIILASTPPEDSEHDFIRYIEECDLKGSLIKKTIDDNPRITQKDKDELIKELGGVTSADCRRELFCEIIKNPALSVIPEFTVELEKEVVKEWARPPFFDCYVSMDLGFKDLTCVLFSYYDFRAGKLIIEDEISMDFKDPNNNLPKLMTSIQNKEKQLWGNPLTNEIKKPYLRVSDINYIVTQEIARSSNNTIIFTPAKKDDKDAALNTVRMMLSGQKIIINPKCKTLIRHLKNVKWASSINKSSFARSIDNGHYDMVDTLIYKVRSLIWNKNPYPLNYELDVKNLYISNPSKFYATSQTEIYKKLFNIKGRKSNG